LFSTSRSCPERCCPTAPTECTTQTVWKGTEDCTPDGDEHGLEMQSQLTYPVEAMCTTRPQSCCCAVGRAQDCSVLPVDACSFARERYPQQPTSKYSQKRGSPQIRTNKAGPQSLRCPFWSMTLPAHQTRAAQAALLQQSSWLAEFVCSAGRIKQLPKQLLEKISPVELG